MSGMQFTKNGSGGIPVDKHLDQAGRKKKLCSVKNPNSEFNPHRIRIPHYMAEQAVKELYGDVPNLVQMIEKYGFIFIEPEENEQKLTKQEEDILKPFLEKTWKNKTNSYVVAEALSNVKNSDDYANIKNIGGFKNALIRDFGDATYKRIDLKKYVPKALQYHNPNDRVSDETMLIESKLTQLLNDGWKDINLHQEMKEYLEMLKKQKQGV